MCNAALSPLSFNIFPYIEAYLCAHLFGSYSLHIFGRICVSGYRVDIITDQCSGIMGKYLKILFILNLNPFLKFRKIV